MTQTDSEERRRKDRERYQKKKEQGLLKTITDFTPREQRQIRKQWREKGKKRREKQRQHDALHNFIETNTPPSTPTLSRASGGSYISPRNRYLLKNENVYLKKKICELESKLAKYRMRCLRVRKNIDREKENKRKPNKSLVVKETKKVVRDFLLQDENSSDGPSTQYRNKSMFNLVATYLSKEFGVDTITWHFSERGHGKGAPDGVGIIDVNYKPMDNYKFPSEPEALNTPDTPEAPNTPEEPSNTPENSTVSMSPGFSDRLTSEVTTDAIQQNVRPTKRLRPRLDLLEDSDSSLEVFPKRKRFSVAMWQDSDDDSIF
ncbi:unnamed protein product [Diatraea saccharalis]|uniref:Uncharacterized protein n=1 Tax=Diatraea saccharalis TaxID=40085 RepID=A0A9N9RCI9_9NEOP|nr:unnamed protein product [Diatraea saccharalis]